MTALVHDDQLDAEHLAQAAPSADEILTGLTDDEQAAGWAVLAGREGVDAAIPGLIARLDDDDLAARAAVWALGRLPAEAALREALPEGGLDLRENAYAALAGIIARDAADAGLGAFLWQRLEAENERSAAGRTGLGEHAARLLAMLGDERAAKGVEAVMAADPYADRFELERLRKAIADGGRDEESRREAAADWSEALADDIAGAVAAEPAPVTADELEIGGGGPAAADVVAVDGEPTGGPTEEAEAAAPDATDPETDDAETTPGEEEVQGIDWQAFLSSPQAQALDDQSLQLVQQLGPMLEQIVARMTGRGLTSLQGEEFAAVLLQVLPQALPPQAVQAALSPEAINSYQALVKWLIATGAAEPDLLEGVAIVREQLQESIRRSGMLGGPDYSDPDAVSEDG